MGATNTTTHYNLSQFVSTDKPAWLQDYNGDMLKIDTAIDAAKVAADTAQTIANAASGASTQNASDITALSTTVSGQGSNITALQLAVNTINSLIGNGTPTTTDQTIIGAINEINAKVTGLSTIKFGKEIIRMRAAQTAADITFDTAFTGNDTPVVTITCDNDAGLDLRCWIKEVTNSKFRAVLYSPNISENTNVTVNYIAVK